ncbi:MAG: DUF2231 domain-containing protein [Calditrichaeota bacterium]|nr:DUF2231 domain-containing protein [Calditrichota bacterium]
MTLIPDWMSNVHPLIVHFPIALLVIAVAADFVGLILRRQTWLKPAALWLYVFGALGTIGAYLSGKQAADIVKFPPPAFPVISTHADLALFTMLFFSIYALLRFLIYWKKWDHRPVVAVLLFVVAAAGLGLIQQTAERGGELVFRYGVGTKTQAVPAAASENKTPAAAIVVGEKGSWRWKAGTDAPATLRQNFNLLRGNWKNLVLQGVQFKNGTPALDIQSKSNEPFLFDFGPNLENVQITAWVNLDGFKGRFFLAHHILGPGAYTFFEAENNQAKLGQMKNGVVKVFDTGEFPQKTWLTFKAVSSKGHFRGYINDKLVAHGHGSDPEAGAAGFGFSGTGNIQIAEIDVISLDEAVPMMNMEHQNMPH